MTTSMRPGHVLAAVGAVVLAPSLWLPWYAVHLSEALGRELDRQTQVAPALGQLARELMAAIPSGLTVTAWQVFDTADIALAACAGAVLFAVVTVSSGTRDPGTAARLALAAGAAAAVLVGVKLASPPGPADLLEVRYGAWVALAGALLVAAGGLMAGQAQGPTAVPAAHAAPAATEPPSGGTALPWDAGASSPPPGR
jgi:hypothetical protein